VGGTIDQGVFWHLFYLGEEQLGTWAGGAPWRLEHWWGSPKPWDPAEEQARDKRACMNRYLWRLEALPEAALRRSRCGARLLAHRERLINASEYRSEKHRSTGLYLGTHMTPFPLPALSSSSPDSNLSAAGRANKIKISLSPSDARGASRASLRRRGKILK